MIKCETILKILKQGFNNRGKYTIWISIDLSSIQTAYKLFMSVVKKSSFLTIFNKRIDGSAVSLRIK